MSAPADRLRAWARNPSGPPAPADVLAVLAERDALEQACQRVVYLDDNQVAVASAWKAAADLCRAALSPSKPEAPQMWDGQTEAFKKWPGEALSKADLEMNAKQLRAALDNIENLSEQDAAGIGRILCRMLAGHACANECAAETLGRILRQSKPEPAPQAQHVCESCHDADEQTAWSGPDGKWLCLGCHVELHPIGGTAPQAAAGDRKEPTR